MEQIWKAGKAKVEIHDLGLVSSYNVLFSKNWHGTTIPTWIYHYIPRENDFMMTIVSQNDIFFGTLLRITYWIVVVILLFLF